MPKRLKLTKEFINNQNINEVVGLNIGYSTGNLSIVFQSAYNVQNPQGIAFDAFGNLWIADQQRESVLMYPPQNQFNGQPATFIIGQSDFSNANNVGLSQTSMSGITRIAFDKNNNLWVANGSSVRGYEYPFGSGGILTMKWMVCSNNWNNFPQGTCTASTIANFLQSIGNFCFDNNNVMWVVDYYNNRVIGFKPEVFYGNIGGNASYVIGQPNLTSHSAQTLSASSLTNPSWVAVDKNGYLWVMDLLLTDNGGYTNGSRILGYKNPYGINVSADFIIGQPNFTTTTGFGTTQNQLGGSPTIFTFDNSGNLWVWDSPYRIIGFEFANLYGNNQPNASYLMFQTSFTSQITSVLNQQYNTQYDMAGFFYEVPIPNEEIVSAIPNPYQISGTITSMAFDKDDNLWISDFSNVRVTQFKNSDIISNAYPYNCSVVLGQSQYYTQGPQGHTQYNLNGTFDIAFDKNNNLWCANGSAAVKGYQYPNYSQQVMQNWAVGGTFDSYSGPASQSTVNDARSVSFDNFGNMFVSDHNYCRFLGFSASSLYGNNQPNAFVVIGQPNFGATAFASPPTASSLYPNPSNSLGCKAVFDLNNNMYVCDNGNNRVVIYPYGSGFTNGMSATIVLGQTSFTTNTYGSSLSELNNPLGVAFDKFGNLWVNDTGNLRVLMFNPPFTIGMSASFSITGFSYSTGGSLIFDLKGNLWVADTNNNRILGFPPSVLYSGTNIDISSATLILGQPNINSTNRGLGTQSLYNPIGLAINPATGDLMCADFYNNRIVTWYYLHKQTSNNVLDSKYIFYNE